MKEKILAAAVLLGLNDHHIAIRLLSFRAARGMMFAWLFGHKTHRRMNTNAHRDIN
jgi:hypothetical protein